MRARLVTAVATVATATLVPALMALAAQPASATPGGNSGTVKIAPVGGAADESNNPHVGCSFDVQWYGFDRSTATVSFESQSPTGAAAIDVTGPTTVQLGDPASGSELNTVRTYTLAFSGDEPQQNQGYHVKLTVAASGANGNDTKTKVFWVDQCESDTDPGTTDPGTTDPVPPFTWEWHYDLPTCDALTVAYPSNIPDGQANDANVRFQTASGEFTLNFHNNTGTWSGTHVFDFKSHPQWPAGLTTYHVVWVQVGGTNYHWQGDVSCSPPPVVEPETPFTWDWHYTDPTCTALTVAYPSNIPDGQANDANIRFESNVGQFTLNFHNNTGTWSGTHVFDYLSHPQWPAGVTSFHVVWTQVGGTNYHWQGDVSCVIEDGTPKAVTNVQGFRTGSLTVGRGSSIATHSVVVDGDGFQELELQTLGANGWTGLRTVSTNAAGTARVTFPKLKRAGTYKFRLAVPGSGISTGDTTGALTVRVR